MLSLPPGLNKNNVFSYLFMLCILKRLYEIENASEDVVWELKAPEC